MFRSHQRNSILREVRVVRSAPGGLLCTINLTNGTSNGQNNRRSNDRFTVKTKTPQIGPANGNFKINGKMTGLSPDSGDSEATILCEFFKTFCRI